ncbi:MAG: hypothetical protein H6R02_2929 [Burkholderiaceae bacterium]|nr:hypothetical protein [Burkholderiaceae bacterium]
MAGQRLVQHLVPGGPVLVEPELLGLLAIDPDADQLLRVVVEQQPAIDVVVLVRDQALAQFVAARVVVIEGLAVLAIACRKDQPTLVIERDRGGLLLRFGEGMELDHLAPRRSR